MNKHVRENLELAYQNGQRTGKQFVQDDSDYPVDPLDLPDYSPAPGKAATEERQGVRRQHPAERIAPPEGEGNDGLAFNGV